MKVRKAQTVGGWPMIVEDKERGDFICTMSESLSKDKANKYAKMIVQAVNGRTS